MEPENARILAELMARDWASRQFKPEAPMAMVKKALINHRNSDEIQAVRVAKEKSGNKPSIPSYMRR
jgi:hypothetical protein